MAHHILCQFENCAIISSHPHLPIMNDYDYETVWEFESSCHDFLEEEDTSYHGSYIDDEMDYERSDSTDYQHLAYIHFA